MPEITEADREQALALAEKLDGAIGPATQLKILERFLAGQREQLTRVDLYEGGVTDGRIEVDHGNTAEIEAALRAKGDQFPNLLIAYTLTLPSGHQFRMGPDQVRELLDELVLTAFPAQADEIRAALP